MRTWYFRAHVGYIENKQASDEIVADVRAHGRMCEALNRAITGGHLGTLRYLSNLVSVFDVTKGSRPTDLDHNSTTTDKKK